MLRYYKGDWDYSLQHPNGGVVTVIESERKIWDKVVAEHALDMYNTLEPTSEQWQEAQHHARPTLHRIFQLREVLK
jgi:hypothetical protein